MFYIKVLIIYIYESFMIIVRLTPGILSENGVLIVKFEPLLTLLIS